MPDGRMRVLGAFAKGRRTGHVPVLGGDGRAHRGHPLRRRREDRHRRALVCAGDPARRAAAQARIRVFGRRAARHRRGRGTRTASARAEYRYERGELAAARAWSEIGRAVAGARGAPLAERDRATDANLYAEFEQIDRREPAALPMTARAATDRRGGDMTTIKRRDVLKSAAAMVAAGAATAGAGTRARYAGRRSRWRRRSSRSPAPTSSSRCAASIASAATTRRTRARWVPTRRASRRSSSRSRPTRSRSCPPGATVDHPYPTLTKNYHYEVELVAALGQGRAQCPDRPRARARLRLHRRARHDAARPAARDGRREEAVGDRQELRPLGAARAAAAGREDGPLHAGRDLAQGQRRRSSRTPTSTR